MFDGFLEVAQDIMPDGWEVVDDATIVCPHGHTIEWDGRCPDGCVSPLVRMGLI